jgi:hypothetical protein
MSSLFRQLNTHLLFLFGILDFPARARSGLCCSGVCGRCGNVIAGADEKGRR